MKPPQSPRSYSLALRKVIVSSVDWELIGLQLLERERRPVLLLDLSGRVMKANRAFLFLLPDGTRTHQVDFANEWLEASSRVPFQRALDGALRGARLQVTVALVNALFPVDLVLELTRVGTGELPTVMAVMIDAVSRGPSLPLSPAAGLTYEVPLDQEGPRHVTRSSAPGTRPVAGDQPCWKSVFNRDAECPVCPVRKLANQNQVTVVADDGGQAGQTVLVAERRGKSAAVTVFPVDAALYSAIIQSRVESLAREGRLSPREREVLGLLVLGRSLNEIATATGITDRTAKFHQQNVLKKLGADNRVDLLRLLL